MEQKKEELKVYKFEVTGLRKNEDGTVSGEREPFKATAERRDPFSQEVFKL